MSYSDHFHLVDDVSEHFDGAVAAVDPQLRSRYAGFYAVASAAVLELALKDIIIGFAQDTNSLFGEYVAGRYEQINGRIKLAHIKHDHLRAFGQKYEKRFGRLIDRIDSHHLKVSRKSVISSYGNLLTCRHTFAHEGVVPQTTTYEEIKQGFWAGKIIMACVKKSLG